jgi:hypothetical protein
MAREPLADRILVQLRLVTARALRAIFHVPDEFAAAAHACLTVPEVIERFRQCQTQLFAHGRLEPDPLEGTFGGDGDWANEVLAYGFMVENTANGVYRL